LYGFHFFSFSLSFIVARIHLKEPISVRVRWDAAENSDESEDGKKEKIDFLI
jgi:hypothetical protein